MFIYGKLKHWIGMGARQLCDKMVGGGSRVVAAWRPSPEQKGTWLHGSFLQIAAGHQVDLHRQGSES